MRHNQCRNVLFVDLSTGGITTRRLRAEVTERYLGGSGLGVRLLMELCDPAIYPFDPHNPLIFVPGLLTGTLVPGATKTSVVAKSPLTRIFGESSVGGSWGAEFRFTGFEALVVIGIAHQPVYLWIDDDRIQIRPAGHLWGKDTFETNTTILAETDPEAKVGCIGPAGEALSWMASIMFEGEMARAAGRTGMGAVMGSKRLKAVAVKGTHGVPVTEAGQFLEWAVREHHNLIVKFGNFTQVGTSASIEVHEERGAVGIKNFSSNDFKAQAARISGPAFRPHYAHKPASCVGCPVHCWVTLASDTTFSRSPEYETVGSFGAMLLNDDPDSIIRANEMANRLGLDTLSLGNTIAFAIEAFERGLIDRTLTGGLDLKWGDPETLLTLIEQVGRREGIGRLLVDGTRAAAKKLGTEALALTVEVKGLEVPMHDPRAFWSSALNYACASRGACHLEAVAFAVESGVPIPEFGYNSRLSPYSPDGKAVLVSQMHDLMAVYNATGMCKFFLRAVGGPVWIVKAVNMAIGWELSWQELMTIGDRIFTLKRLFNVRAGVTQTDDTLPERIATLDRSDRHRAVPVEAFEQMRTEYYGLRGWDQDGRPTSERLAGLGLLEQEELFID